MDDARLRILSLTAPLCLAANWVVTVTPGNAQELVTPTTVISSTASRDTYPASNLIDGSGLSGPVNRLNYREVTHGTAHVSRSWGTEAPGGAGSDYFATSAADPSLTLHLGESFPLSGLVVWGYHFIVPSNNEARDIAVEFSSDGGATWPASTTVIHERTAAASEALLFPSIYIADTVRLTFTDNHFGAPGAAGGDRVGLGEIRLLSDPPPIPHPVLATRELLDFGDLPAGSAGKTIAVPIENQGSEEALEVSLASVSDPFTADALPLAVPPGETREFEVVFDPAGAPGCHDGNLVLSSNDPDRASVAIRLLGGLACAASPPPQPHFSRPEGTFTDPFEVAVVSEAPDAVLVYTTDGSLPGPDNGLLYRGPIAITSSIQLRAAALLPGVVSKPQTASYLRLSNDLANYQSPLPLVFIDNFARGTIPNKGWTTANQTGAGLQQLARQPAFLQIVDRDAVTGKAAAGSPAGFTERIGIRVRGAFSSTWNPKPYSFETWDEFDDDKSTKPLGMPGESDWILYYPHPVYDRTLLSNTFTWELSRQTGRYGTRFRFVDLFVNEDGGDLTLADRRGVYSLAEKVKRDDDRIEFEPLSEDGTTGGWLLGVNRMDPAPVGGYPAPNGATSPQFFHTAGPNRILETTANSAGRGDDHPRQYNAFINFEDPNGYEINRRQRSTIEDWFREFEDVFYDDNLWLDPENGYRQYVDTRDFIDYFHLLNLAKQGDGLLLSMFPWVSSGERKLHMGPMWDFNNGAYQGNPDSFAFYRSERLWYKRLLEDPAYLREHIDRWFELRRGPLSITNMHAIVDAQAGEITDRLAIAQGISSATTWSSHLAAMKNYLANRVRWLDDQFFKPPTLSHPGGTVGSPFELVISNETGTEGTIHYTVDGSDPIKNGLVYTGPIAFNATAQIKARIQAPDGEWSALNAASYITGSPPQPGDLLISEIMYHPRDDGESEYLELLNVRAETTLDLSLVRFAAGIEFTFPVGSVLEPGERILVVRNLAAFEAIHGTNLAVAGEFQDRSALDNSGDRLILHDANGAVLLDFRYNDRHPWPESADGDGDSLVLVEPAANPESGDPGAWRSSVFPGGSPGSDDVIAFAGEVDVDTDSDGLPAILEHALGTSDQSPDILSDHFAWQHDALTGTAIWLTRSLAAADVAVVLEWSDDLAGWQPVEAQPVVEARLTAGRARFRWHLPAPQPAARYFRLQAELQPN